MDCDVVSPAYVNATTTPRGDVTTDDLRSLPYKAVAVFVVDATILRPNNALHVYNCQRVLVLYCS